MDDGDEDDDDDDPDDEDDDDDDDPDDDDDDESESDDDDEDDDETLPNLSVDEQASELSSESGLHVHSGGTPPRHESIEMNVNLA